MLEGGLSDPTYRIGKLAAANRPPVSIAVDAPLREAVTLMMLHDFSQLPVMQGTRAVKGIITWQSIGSRLALGTGGETVRDFMEPASEISADAALAAAIRTIVDRQYVLVRDAEQQISGIVTTTDVSLRFQQPGPELHRGECSPRRRSARYSRGRHKRGAAHGVRRAEPRHVLRALARVGGCHAECAARVKLRDHGHAFDGSYDPLPFGIPCDAVPVYTAPEAGPDEGALEGGRCENAFIA
ncbi:MAG: CBS domain-containing protein [Chloroflexi bacterium]|nr:CBS domain-containing protein [Chloroflexota bacterium]